MGKENANIPPLRGNADELRAVVKVTPDKQRRVLEEKS
jgi:hypothetical protein